MSEIENLESMRRAALDRIDRSERNTRWLVLAAAGLECLFLAGFLLLANFSDRLHVLLLLCTIAIYSIVGIGLLALGSYLKLNTNRILKAIEIMSQPR
jgi:hypothetical protein